MIEMRQIQVFLAISEHLNFSRAAEKIYLTQPTVSGHLKNLENFLKVQLVDRSGREVRLTSAGEIFLPFARRIFALQEKARKEMRLYAGAEHGKLEIGGSNTPGQYILPAVIGRFTQSRQQTKVTLRIEDSQSIIDLVGDGELELGLVGNPPTDKDFISIKCQGDELYLVASPARGRSISSPLSLETLRKLPFIIREKGSGTRRSMLSVLQQRGLTKLEDLNLVAEMGSAEAVRQAVKNDLGVTIISNLCVDEDLKNGNLQQLSLPDGPIKRDFYLIYNRDRRLSPLAELFKEYILNPEKT